MQAEGPRFYDAFGLTLKSDFALPELGRREISPVAAQSADVVEIKRSRGELSLAGSDRLADWIEVKENACLYRFEGFCRMLVEEGRKVTVEVLPDAAEEDMRAFLFGSAIGTIAHQRRLVPLHISAVETGSGAAAFTGSSGAGKSTMVAALSKYNGWQIVCDDMACLDPERGDLRLHAGVQRNKLWIDAINSLGLSDSPMSRDLARADKFHIELAEPASAAFGPMRTFFLLEWADDFTIERLSAGRSFEALINSVYRPNLVPIFNSLDLVRGAAISMARVTECYVLKRPRALSRLPEIAARLSEFLEKRRKTAQ